MCAFRHQTTSISMSTELRAAIAKLEKGAMRLSTAETSALQPCDDVASHWRQVQEALAMCRAETKQAADADDVKPLASLSVDAGDMWVYLQLAKRIAALREGGTTPCVGICAPTGAGGGMQDGGLRCRGTAYQRCLHLP